ncbi:MAG: hypothetical protein ACRCTJ_00965 [Brevinema sp.]
MRKIIFLFIIVFITGNSYSQSKEESDFLLFVSEQTIDPNPGKSYGFLEFSENGRTVCLTSPTINFGFPPFYFDKIEDNMAIYRGDMRKGAIFLNLGEAERIAVELGEKDPTIFLALKVKQSTNDTFSFGMAFSTEQAIQEAKDFRIEE